MQSILLPNEKVKYQIILTNDPDTNYVTRQTGDWTPASAVQGHCVLWAFYL